MFPNSIYFLAFSYTISLSSTTQGTICLRQPRRLLPQLTTTPLSVRTSQQKAGIANCIDAATAMNKGPFFTPSNRIFADKIDPHVNSNAVDSVLNTLSNLNQQIHDDFNTVRRDLDNAHEENARLSKALQHQRQINASHQRKTV